MTNDVGGCRMLGPPQAHRSSRYPPKSIPFRSRLMLGGRSFRFGFSPITNCTNVTCHQEETNCAHGSSGRTGIDIPIKNMTLEKSERPAEPLTFFVRCSRRSQQGVGRGGVESMSLDKLSLVVIGNGMVGHR